MEKKEPIKPYKEDFVHRYTRRKKKHDYRDPWRYHITITKAKGAPAFGKIKIDNLTPDGVSVTLSPLGEIIEQRFDSIHEHNPQIILRNKVVMPDHIHMVVCVTERMEKPLGNYIGAFKTGIANLWRDQIGDKDAQIFEKGFTDKIIFSFRSIDDVDKYVHDNPYRLAVRKQRPDFFHREKNLILRGRKCRGYGNLFHLRNPFKIALIVHRSDNEEVFEIKRQACLTVMQKGGVVVSAFISPREKEIRKTIEEAGGRIIFLQHYCFSERSKPAKHDFELCCDGRLLIISPEDFAHLESYNQKMEERPTRGQCLDMNTLAERIAEMNPSEFQTSR